MTLSTRSPSNNTPAMPEQIALDDADADRLRRAQERAQEAQQKIQRAQQMLQKGQQELDQAQGYAEAVWEPIEEKYDIEADQEEVVFDEMEGVLSVRTETE